MRLKEFYLKAVVTSENEIIIKGQEETPKSKYLTKIRNNDLKTFLHNGGKEEIEKVAKEKDIFKKLDGIAVGKEKNILIHFIASFNNRVEYGGVVPLYIASDIKIFYVEEL